ncbi:MAG: NRAMP family divalent metal transporter [Halomonadaceae bacterium]|uniref:Divalent metal cation transporter n=1 Tax=Halomonas colorata TaxID=2742615 RepID=A0ABR9FU39_9GAMM|nr:divalent metal cation transporter [Halomonas colorata]MBE0462170.1 divalent metal cation transporter [Halomonas colorata]
MPPQESSTLTAPAKSVYAKYLAALGPGFLFAGAAIGTSHVVQSTRAGAEYGIGLLGFILLAVLLKYPSFFFGPFYVSVTGKSLIEGYRQTFGKSVVALFALVQIPVTAIIIAAIAITTAGLAGSIVPLSLSPPTVAVILIALCCALTFVGGYKLLDWVNKVFIVILSVTTVFAALAAVPLVDWTLYPATAVSPLWSTATFITLVAVLGLMPSDITLAIMNSLWSEARNKNQGVRSDTAAEKIDFNIGYIGAAVLAACFVIMGAGVMHSQGITPADGAVGFASQVISLYTSTLGEWSGVVVGISAFTVMLTTLLTVLDGFPRMITASYYTFTRAENDGEETRRIEGSRAFLACMIGLSLLAIVILYTLMGSFRLFMDFVMVVAFLISPILATLNHLTANGSTVPLTLRPSKLINAWSWLAIATLALLSLGYIYVRFIY